MTFNGLFIIFISKGYDTKDSQTITTSTGSKKTNFSGEKSKLTKKTVYSAEVRRHFFWDGGGEGRGGGNWYNNCTSTDSVVITHKKMGKKWI